MTDADSPFSLRNRVALVTGGAGHLGSAMVAALARAGAHVLVNGRTAARVDALVATLRATGLSAERAVFDVTQEADVDAFFAAWPRDRLHIVVNNAYAGGAGTIESSGGDSYRDSFEASVVAAHHVTHAALSRLRAGAADGLASVVNVASMYAVVSPDQRLYDSHAGANPPFYGAAKAALLQWTRYAACEFGPEGIRFNAISPGPFPSDAVQHTNPTFIARLAAKVPLGRIGTAPEVGGAVVFLASSAASYVNGANLVVDGGWTCW
jgi:NAD(P)-dependent dehydrogenase (short-subunit alcohol dehydrogenase family)